MVPPG